MAQVETVIVGLDSDCRASIAASLESLSVLVAGIEPEGFADAISRLGVTGHDLGDLLGGEAIELAASGAKELHGFEVKPGNGYLKLFAALAGDAHKHSIRVRHGWPILSSDSPAATLTRVGAGVEAP